MEVLIFSTFALTAVNTLCGLVILRHLRQHPAAAPDAPPWTSDTPPQPSEEARPLRLDEGFENLMAYQVKLGRGRTTGGEAG